MSKSAMDAAREYSPQCADCIADSYDGQCKACDVHIARLAEALESYANDRAKAVFEATREKAAEIARQLAEVCDTSKGALTPASIICRLEGGEHAALRIRKDIRAITFADVAGEE